MEKTPQAILDGVEARLPRWMVLFATIGAVAFLLARQPGMAAGFAVGAALSILGFRWLERGIAAALDASRTRVPRSVGIRLMLRYPILIGVIFVFYVTHWLPVEGVILGFFVPIAGAITESLSLLGRMIFDHRT
jgi:hypothetical protein